MGSKLKYKIKFIFDWRVKLRRKSNWVKGLKNNQNNEDQNWNKNKNKLLIEWWNWIVKLIKQKSPKIIKKLRIKLKKQYIAN
jgi:hypothetical protein